MAKASFSHCAWCGHPTSHVLSLLCVLLSTSVSNRQFVQPHIQLSTKIAMCVWARTHACMYVYIYILFIEKTKTIISVPLIMLLFLSYDECFVSALLWKTSSPYFKNLNKCTCINMFNSPAYIWRYVSAWATSIQISRRIDRSSVMPCKPKQILIVSFWMLLPKKVYNYDFP